VRREKKPELGRVGEKLDHEEKWTQSDAMKKKERDAEIGGGAQNIQTRPM